ncbi:hypothetical protein NDU88_003041 [Pleurodeles waltl]|uniref:Uncharacterized protein n=1 Tax=Pleurodeles waltl TaxID=8319 RepID=A0AAV7VCB2_PLEWA|nr:hypothetical protein NDU88_003041 [Pleurodeles waltl]
MRGGMSELEQFHVTLRRVSKGVGSKLGSAALKRNDPCGSRDHNIDEQGMSLTRCAHVRMFAFFFCSGTIVDALLGPRVPLAWIDKVVSLATFRLRPPALNRRSAAYAPRLI